MKIKTIAILTLVGLLSQGLLSQSVLLYSGHTYEKSSPECMACSLEVSKGFFYQFYNTSSTFKSYWDKARKFERSTSKDYRDTISSNVRANFRAFHELCVGRFDLFQERCPYVSKSTYDQIQEIASSIQEDEEANRMFHLFLFAKDFGWIDTGRPEFREIIGAKIMGQIGAELQFEDPNFLSYWMREHLSPMGMFLGEISVKKAEEILSNFDQKQGKYLKMLCLLSFLEAHTYLKSHSLIFEKNASFLASLADSLKHKELLEELQGKRLERIASAALKNGQTTPEKSLEIDRNTLIRKEELEVCISCFSSEDQSKILKLLDNVDFHFFAETFPKMEPYSISRFLKISANLCFPNEGELSHEDIFYVGKGYEDVFNRLFFQKIGEEEFIRRHVSVDTHTNWLVWNPEF